LFKRLLSAKKKKLRFKQIIASGINQAPLAIMFRMQYHPHRILCKQ